MWSADRDTLSMVEGEFGIALEITVKDVNFSDGDTLRYTFKDRPNGNTILTKDFTTVTDNEIALSFTQAESALFKPGVFVYTVDWLRNGEFQCTLLENSKFKVVDKA